MAEQAFFDLDKIKQIAKKAGDEIIKYYHEGFSVEMKEGNQPLTEADLASNNILQKELSQFGFPILSEESQDDKIRLKSEFVWIIDPLDGTSDFIQKTDEFCVMIGLVKENKVILGVVYEPVIKRFYYAKKGDGAFFEQDGRVRKIEVSAEDDFRKMKILVSRNHLKDAELKLTEKLNLSKIPQGSAGLKIVKVASGEGEIYINSSNKTSEWDTCAGVAILNEAGGKITDMQGNEILYNQNNPCHQEGFVVSNGLRHQEIVDELREIIAENK